MLCVLLVFLSSKADANPAQSVTSLQDFTSPSFNPSLADCEVLLNRLESKLMRYPSDEVTAHSLKVVFNVCQQLQQAQFQLVAQKFTSLGSNSEVSQALKSNAYKTGFELTIALGYSSNPLYVSDYQNIDLILNDQPVTFINEQEPSASALGLIQAQVIMKNKADQHVLTYSKQAYQEPNESRINVLYSGLSFINKASSESVRILRFGSELRSEYSDHRTRLYLGMLEQLSPQSLMNVQVETNRFRESSVNDSNQIELQFMSQHTLGKARNSQKMTRPAENGFTTLMFRIGATKNRPLNDRAGGEQSGVYARALFSQWLQGHQFSISASVARLEDQARYSDVLLENKKRHLINYNTYLKWGYFGFGQASNLGGDEQGSRKKTQFIPFAELGFTRQTSNLELFSWKNTELMAGLKIKW